MISETNRKRRRLERERRAIERPQPGMSCRNALARTVSTDRRDMTARRIPKPPHDTPVPPTLRKIVKAFPFAGNNQSQRGKNEHRLPPVKTVSPALTTLSASDITADLNYLYQSRRAAYDNPKF